MLLFRNNALYGTSGHLLLVLFLSYEYRHEKSLRTLNTFVVAGLPKMSYKDMQVH